MIDLIKTEKELVEDLECDELCVMKTKKNKPGKLIEKKLKQKKCKTCFPNKRGAKK